MTYSDGWALLRVFLSQTKRHGQGVQGSQGHKGVAHLSPISCVCDTYDLTPCFRMSVMPVFNGVITNRTPFTIRDSRTGCPPSSCGRQASKWQRIDQNEERSNIPGPSVFGVPCLEAYISVWGSPARTPRQEGPGIYK